MHDPKESCHIIGDNAMQFALWMAAQINDNFQLAVGPDEAYNEFIRHVPNGRISSSFHNHGLIQGQPTLLILESDHPGYINHVHDSIALSDRLYTVQTGDVYDASITVPIVDSDTVLLSSPMYVYGDGCVEFVKSIEEFGLAECQVVSVLDAQTEEPAPGIAHIIIGAGKPDVQISMPVVKVRDGKIVSVK